MPEPEARDVRLRPATVSDVRAIAEFQTDCWREGPPRGVRVRARTQPARQGRFSCQETPKRSASQPNLVLKPYEPRGIIAPPWSTSAA